ncbi:hypothetical protein AMTRI_Chr06g174180 [Amborella trichopoda]|uniref:uncharacterized protein LOC18434989 n=1 Tax=Amborella trichopoda TaxID=13333 RepID=UPI0005D34583|nr:uncharacterized protein LOC18434989 [Amborella trichopoda]|eukprot:XP_006845109.2 uncharacterized protein LOC18434989 [Amborella trichopoda]
MAKPVAAGLLVFNFCMYFILASLGGWAINYAIDHGFVIGAGLALPAAFSPIYFPMGNAATGFFVIFAVLAGVVGAASAVAGTRHIMAWKGETISSALVPAVTAWALTLISMGLACKEINLTPRNANLRTMEAFTIILSVTQVIYIAVIHTAVGRPRT